MTIQEKFDLTGRVAIVTGGSLGIGLAVAEGLAAEGVHLAICARDEARVVRVANDIASKYGVKTIGVKADVSKAEDIERFVASTGHALAWPVALATAGAA